MERKVVENMSKPVVAIVGRPNVGNMSAPMKKLLERYARVVELVKVDSISVTPCRPGRGRQGSDQE